MKKLILNAVPEGHITFQVEKTMTVGELIRFLEDYDKDMPVYLSFNNGSHKGFAHGGVLEQRFEERLW